MTSKWQKLAGKFAKKVESDNREKIDKCKADLLGLAENKKPRTQIDLAVMYGSVSEEKDAIEERLKDLNVLKQAITEILLDAWEKEGVQEKSFNGVGKLITMIDPYCQFKDIQALKPYLNKFGMSHLVQETIVWMAGNSFIKEQLENGHELPDPKIVPIFMKHSLRLYKEKG